MKEFLKKHWRSISTVVILVISSLTLLITNPMRFGELLVEAQIIMAEEAKQALITVDGEEELIDAPTVETVESGKVEECPEGMECGRGWYVPTYSPAAFRDATNSQCVDTDGAYGSQCWDLGNLFWQNYASRNLNTCGTGAAKGTIQDGCWQKNAGSEFTMIWDKTQLQAGDWVVFNNGKWGHVGMALGSYNDGYVALFGTNQGGTSCNGGGSTANTINKSLGDFAGAFRPNIYILPEPTPEPEPTPAPTAYTVKKGDTLGDIILYMGWWSNTEGLFGDSGYAQKIADFNGIKNRGLIYPDQEIRNAE
ncbi:LysM domain-containing protein [Christensenellaceae bacterium OttesenSCG-928-L17]|nr:LysM domain-containing protein [Christensenellaceae bacterium OttesenSCG-928-L17]